MTDRLSRLDRSFLAYESPVGHMHIAGTATLEAGSLRRTDGGIDISRIRAYVESRLHRIPRYRQVVASSPWGGQRWVDDPHFDIEYHVRHTSLPPPGDEGQLKALCGRVCSQALDRTKPLWEMWIVDRVGGGERFGFICKVHHAMVDGVGSVDLIGQLLTQEPLTDLEAAPTWVARPAPSTARLALDDLSRLAGAPLGLLRRLPGMLSQARKPGSDLRAGLRGLTDLALKTLRRPSETPFNQPIGTHRRFDWLVTGLDAVQAIRKALGGTVNDIVLATVTGGVRRFLSHRGVSPDGLQFRVMAPVNVRMADGQGELGNRVAAWMVELPIAEPDPRRRLEILQETTLRLKEEKSALGFHWFTEMTGWAPTSLLSLGARLSQPNLPFNMVVTNVPGPPRPLHFLSARMLDYYGLVPLTDYLGLGIVVFSYAGKLNWGFNADWDLVPDVDVFAGCIEAAFKELSEVAR